MFHLQDNIFFGRCRDGSVRIVVLDRTPDTWPKVTDSLRHAAFNTQVTAAAWASVVASVSARGENADTHGEALNFHSAKVSFAKEIEAEQLLIDLTEKLLQYADEKGLITEHEIRRLVNAVSVCDEQDRQGT